MQTQEPPILPPICHLFRQDPEVLRGRPLHAGQQAKIGVLEVSCTLITTKHLLTCRQWRLCDARSQSRSAQGKLLAHHQSSQAAFDLRSMLLVIQVVTDEGVLRVSSWMTSICSLVPQHHLYLTLSRVHTFGVISIVSWKFALLLYYQSCDSAAVLCGQKGSLACQVCSN